MTVLITLTTYGSDTGPFFDLFSDADNYAVAFESGVSKVDLIAGYTSALVPNTATVIRVKSTGECTNYVDIVLETAPIVIDVTNTSTDVIITDIQIDGNSITPTVGSFPVATGDSMTGTISNALGIGTGMPIVIIYTFTAGGQNLSCIGATPDCEVAAASPYTSSRDIVAGDTIVISASDGACS